MMGPPDGTWRMPVRRDGGERVAQTSPRDRLLNAAVKRFCRNGINATGINAVLEEAGTAKLTLYNQFGSKDGLVIAVLEREGSKWREWFRRHLAAQSGSPRDRLLSVFDLLDQWFRRPDFYGCPLINAVAEHDKLSTEIRDVASDHRAQVMVELVALAREAGAVDPEGLCKQLALLKDGAIVGALMAQSPEPAANARKAAAVLIDAHLKLGRSVAA